ncbi:hypothetical protein O7599_26415 [Streptomyces sp. WMMC500]|uniref:hypothetical protein n=1 Tax=Streptomyces sp. WMMC500 TaxID=3015154 RepID=UPI00248B808A|nr:hypothetical protein [Streptomyces sp. WMMC500]WBB59109.1 hypothetical protein O7599_26415 [Streptomyces sp. WMMC500]
MNDGEVIAYFDGRPTAEITIHSAWDVPRMADMAYEFGYVLCRVFHWRSTTRLVFERDDTDHARRRAVWSLNYYRAYGRWGRQQPQFQLPSYMGRRVEPLDAARARYALALFRNKVWHVRLAISGAALIAVVVWHYRDSVAVVVPVALAGGSLMLVAGISPWLPSKRLRRYEQTVKTFELQQAVERGFIPPPPPSNGD